MKASGVWFMPRKAVSSAAASSASFDHGWRNFPAGTTSGVNEFRIRRVRQPVCFPVREDS
jgi:hypothetical protein